jgi:hypothetical protein
VNNFKIYFFSLFIVFVSIINAQDYDSTQNEHFSFRDNPFSSEGKSPVIIFNYGLSKISRDNFGDAFSNPNLVEVKLGYMEKHLVSESNGIYSSDMRDLFVDNISTRLSNNSGAGKLQTNTWRIGIDRMQGYGYSFGEAGLTLNSAYSFIWSNIEFLNESGDSAGREIKNLYNKQFKFGTSSEANIQLDFTQNIGINAGYERAIVFQRHLVWKWIASEIIEFAVMYPLDNFIEDFMDRAPAAAPLVNFVLKNALYYGLYELRHKKMNWPFESAPPIAFDQFKFGLVFNF